MLYLEKVAVVMSVVLRVWDVVVLGQNCFLSR